MPIRGANANFLPEIGQILGMRAAVELDLLAP
jgi:hypothetical protein